MNNMSDRLYISNIKKLKAIYKLMEKVNELDSNEYTLEKWVELFGLTKDEAEKLFGEMTNKGVGV
jgi:hypothetical protein